MPSLLPIQVRNLSTETVPSFGIMRPTGTEIINGKWTIQIDKPNDTFMRYYLVNGPCRIKPDSGTSIGNVKRLATLYDDYPKYALIEKDGEGDFPAFGDEWGPKNDSWALHKGRSGFTIWDTDKEKVIGVGGESASTLYRALVKQIEIRTVKAKLTSSLAQGSTATAMIWVKNEVGSNVVSEYEITVEDWLLKASTNVASGTAIIVEYMNGAWVVTEIGDCPQSS